eukprot:2226988-Amphidinium_carterae.1
MATTTVAKPRTDLKRPAAAHTEDIECASTSSQLLANVRLINGQHRNGRSMRLKPQQTKGDRRRASPSFAAHTHPRTVAPMELCA